MAVTDEIPNQDGEVLPFTKFSFQVKWGSDSLVMNFQAVSGLDVESHPVEYRQGEGPVFSVVKASGITRHASVTLKQGIFVSSNKFWDWFNQIKMNTLKRVTVTISLLDEAGDPAMVWTLAGAWPAKISVPDMKAEGSEASIESMEIVYEGLTVANAL